MTYRELCDLRERISTNLFACQQLFDVAVQQDDNHAARLYTDEIRQLEYHLDLVRAEMDRVPVLVEGDNNELI